jgi:hypothetical protein
MIPNTRTDLSSTEEGRCLPRWVAMHPHLSDARRKLRLVMVAGQVCAPDAFRCHLARPQSAWYVRTARTQFWCQPTPGAAVNMPRRDDLTVATSYVYSRTLWNDSGSRLPCSGCRNISAGLDKRSGGLGGMLFMIPSVDLRKRPEQ